MSETSVEVAEERHDRTVTVTVNNRAVELDRHRVTGLEIKQAAIAQGVPFFFKQWGAWGADGVRRDKKRNGRELSGRRWDEFPVRVVSEAC